MLFFMLISITGMSQSYVYLKQDSTSSILVKDILVNSQNDIYVFSRVSDSTINTGSLAVWFNSRITKLDAMGNEILSKQLDSFVINKVIKCTDNHFLIIGDKLYSPNPALQVDFCIYKCDSLLNLTKLFDNISPSASNYVMDAEFLNNKLLIASYYFDTIFPATNLTLIDTSIFAVQKQNFLPYIVPCCELWPSLFFNFNSSKVYLTSVRSDSTVVWEIDTSDLSFVKSIEIKFDAVFDGFPYGIHGPGINNYQIIPKSPNEYLITAKWMYDTVWTLGPWTTIGFVLADSNFVVYQKNYFESDSSENAVALEPMAFVPSTKYYYYGYTKDQPTILANLFQVSAITTIIKMDTLGNQVWQKNFGDSVITLKLFYVRATTDGGVVFGGTYINKNASFSYSPTQFLYGIFVIKLDSLGNILSYSMFDETVHEVLVYPNPFTDQFKLQLPSANCKGVISIVDLYGRTVYSQNFNAVNSATLDVKLPEIKNGNYILNIMTPDFRSSKKLIKVE